MTYPSPKTYEKRQKINSIRQQVALAERVEGCSPVATGLQLAVFSRGRERRHWREEREEAWEKEREKPVLKLNF